MLDFLKEYIDELVQEGLRKGFWLNHFRNLPTLEDMHDYVKSSGIPYLGSGSARDVYSISTGKVLKIAGGILGNSAQSQNGMEISNWLNYKNTGALAKIYDWDKNHLESWWILMEAIRTFEDPEQMLEETGIPIGFLMDLTRLKRIYSSAKTMLQIKQNVIADADILWDDVNVSRVRQGLAGYESNPKGRQLVDHFNTLMDLGFDIDLVNNRHWGVSASGNIVAVDYALLDTE